MSDDDLLLMLETGSKILKTRLDMPRSAEIIDDIKNELSSSTYERESLNSKFRKLQTTAENEFGKNDHRKNCIIMLNKQLRKALVLNLSEVKKIRNQDEVVKIITQRANAYRNLQLLRKIVTSGATNEEEGLIGISYGYLAQVDGIYKKSLQDCYVWEKLGNKEKIEAEKVPKMSVADLKNYFEKMEKKLFYFEGWDSIVRNSVGHSAFQYDKQKRKMVYNDLYAKKTTEYTIDEMIALYDKMENIFQLIMSTNQIIQANDIIERFLQKKSSS